MEELDLGNNFINAISAIYQKQRAAIRVNNDITNSFNVEKGTRQGCPLSPLLFILVIEILLIKVREVKEIPGLRYRGWEYKTRAFVNDLVFILEDPLETLTKIVQVINAFGNLAGFYLNQSKSKILLKNMTSKRVEEIKKLTKCEIISKVKYLGITLSSKNTDLFKNNLNTYGKS